MEEIGNLIIKPHQLHINKSTSLFEKFDSYLIIETGEQQFKS